MYGSTCYMVSLAIMIIHIHFLSSVWIKPRWSQEFTHFFQVAMAPSEWKKVWPGRFTVLSGDVKIEHGHWNHRKMVGLDGILWEIPSGNDWYSELEHGHWNSSFSHSMVIFHSELLVITREEILVIYATSQMDMKPQFKAYATCPAEDWVVEKPNKNDSWDMNHSP